MYPIKYIENNLVFNQEGECFAYYELVPYNYSFLSPEARSMPYKLLQKVVFVPHKSDRRRKLPVDSKKSRNNGLTYRQMHWYL